MGSAPPVRIVLVDDHEMVIEGLKAMLAAFDSRVTVVGQAVGADRVLSVVGDLDPDIVLCDVRMQGSSGLDVCQQLRERDPDRKVVMLSVYDDEMTSIMSEAVTLEDKGDLKGAFRTFKKAVEAGVSALGEDHMHVITAKLALANLLAENPELGVGPQQVQKLYEDCIAAMSTKAFLGPFHVSTLAAKMSMAKLLGPSDVQKAHWLLLEVIKGYESQLGPAVIDEPLGCLCP